MGAPLPLQCQCGSMRGGLRRAQPQLSSRLVCYCDDCQAFARWLKRPELLDRWGGSAVVQVPPACVHLTDGCEMLRCIRLTENGLYRWYAGCCRTPFGNSLGPGLPFIGMFEAMLSPSLLEPQRQRWLGGVSYVQGRFARGGVPPHAPATVSPRTLASSMAKLASWWWRGLATPSPVFDGNTPRAIPEVLTGAERRELAQAWRCFSS